MRKRYLVTGRVQGVGFRQFTAHCAQNLGLVGWVRNLPDGRVEAEAQGSEDGLRKFEQQLHRGPPLSRVEKITSAELAEVAAESGFIIRR